MPNKVACDVLFKVDEQRIFSKNKIESGIAHWTMGAADERALLGTLFHPNISGTPILGNQPLRRLAIVAMLDVVSAAFRKHNRNNLYLITFCLDEGMTWEYRPEVDLVALGRKVDKALRWLDVSGVGAFEIDSLRPIAGDGDQGRRLWTHAHVLARSRPSGFDHEALERSINSLPAFKNCLGAKPVDIRPITPTGPDLGRVAAYLFEYRHHAKLVRRAKWGGNTMDPVREGFQPASAVRLAELESQIALPDLVFGVGRIGVELRRRWKVRFEDLRDALPGLAVDVGNVNDIAGLWQRVRVPSRNGSRSYRPCQITTRSSAYRDGGAPRRLD